MFSMTSLLASLPAASLAESDLPRFVTRVFGRRQASELPGIRAVLDEEPLSGYPPALGALLAASAERMVAEGTDPGELDPPMAERILASSAFLRAVERRRPMDRQLLRPGEVLTPPLREMLGTALHVLPGVGPQLALVAPVAVVHLPGVRYSIPRGVVLARAMTLEEADAMRLAWGAVEEAFPSEDPEASSWHARFVVAARRINLDAAAVVGGLSAVPAARRQRLWGEIIEHLRDQEVVEEHRPGQRGLNARLGKLGVTPDTPWVAPLVTLAEHAFARCGPEPEALRGVSDCSAEDIATFSGWVEVPSAARERLRELTPAEITRHLATLADVESGRLDVAFPKELVRPLRAFRDRLLKPRYGRAVASLLVADPLRLAEEHVRRGEDRQAILAALEALADEAGAAAAARPPVTLPLTVGRDLDGFSDDDEPDPDEQVDEVAAGGGRELAAPPVGASSERPAAVPPASDVAEEEAPVEEPSPLPSPPARARPAGQGGVRPPRFELPPMPSPPPPRPRPRTRPRSEFPPMPSGELPPPRRQLVDPERVRAATRPPGLRGPEPAPHDASRTQVAPASSAETETPLPRAERPPTGPRALPARPPTRDPEPRLAPSSRPSTVRPAEAEPVRSRPMEPPLPRGGRPRTGADARPPSVSLPPSSPAGASPGRRRPPTVPHLVTPKQGEAFYESAFKELELLERDLLRRGPWRAAHERVDALDRDAAELASALGPSARSGDKDFSGALRRVEMVQAYLERIRPLLDGEGPPGPSEPDPEPPRGGLRRLFGRRR